jgi:NAD(P)-dependent dehydrogenase (short-subunit alcohol dehydrogenase family)
MRLSGRRALVTGGSRGIGRAIALALAGEGADVAVSYRADRESAEATAAAVRALGRKAIIVQGDAGVRADVNRFVSEAAAALGGIDLLVNNAGVLKRTPFLEIEEREWDAIVDTNLKGAFLVAQAVARQMVERGLEGSIVNLSSSAAVRPSPNLAHYSVSKAGVSMLTQVMAVELAPYGIRVNGVCPGTIETDLNRKDIAEPGPREARLARIPLRRIGAPEDVTGAVVFLASIDETRLVTGALVVVDGGFTLA